jgi:hypothetical protein
MMVRAFESPGESFLHILSIWSLPEPASVTQIHPFSRGQPDNTCRWGFKPAEGHRSSSSTRLAFTQIATLSRCGFFRPGFAVGGMSVTPRSSRVGDNMRRTVEEGAHSR